MTYNFKQKEAIQTIDGPILIIAGPGTGKTFTLVERVKYMIRNKNIDPSSILISTFTNKAAFELKDRLSLNFKKENIDKDINDMVVGNFHSICRDINEKYIEYTYLKAGYSQIDDTGQAYLIYRYLSSFRKIPGYSQVINGSNHVKNIVNLVNSIREEGILERTSKDPIANVGLQILNLYEKLLEKYNLIDFSGILFTTYKLLVENDHIVKEIHKKINYIMIDEYQDTNYIQEQIIFKMLNENKNLCVVGDDDQSLYRFRGASVRNILEFDNRIDQVKVIKLMQNYRSEDSIIRFYSSFLENLSTENDEYKKYRYPKLLFSDKLSGENRVVKLYSQNEEEWIEKTCAYMKDLYLQGAINSYNEIAVLFSSVNNPSARKFISHAKKQGIGVYIPKRSTLLSKKEVKEMIAGLYTIFRRYIDRSKVPDSRTYAFLEGQYSLFEKYIQRHEDLKDFIEKMSDYLSEEGSRISLHDIYYRLFAYEPFYKYMKNEEKAKGLSRYLELLDTFSLINQIYYVGKDNLDKFISTFFFNFISFINDRRSIAEFDEETKIPDENSISALTIHASKGMEYPVVFMGSLWDKPFASRKYKSNIERIVDILKEEYTQMNDFEPIEIMENLDFHRKYYTGFSRAKDLLVLSGFGSSISSYLIGYFNNLNEVPVKELELEKGPIKDNKVRKSYSYTADIVPYRDSSIKYYYERILKFRQPKTKALFYGSIVHESIEAINNMIIKNQELQKLDSYKLVRDIGAQKYRQGAIDIRKEDIEKAHEEVCLYLENLKDIGKPLNSELNIFYSTDDYALTGNVDMIFENDGKLHIMDFKTGRPVESHEDDSILKSYINQINLYAYLYEKTKNREIFSVSLYFTDLYNSKNIYTYPVNKDLNEKILKDIEKTIKDIENEKFNFENYDPNKAGLLKFFLNRYYKEVGDIQILS